MSEEGDSKIKGGYYIKAKKIQNSAIAHTPPYVREIWDWLLLNANWKDTEICKRGQLLTSFKAIQDGLHWMAGWRKETYSKSDCEKAMNFLRRATMIATEKTTRGMFITVLNYDKYQTFENYEKYNESNKKATRKQQTADTIQKELEGIEVRNELNTIATDVAEVKKEKKKRDTQPHFALIEHFFQLKGWEMDYKVAKRYLRAATDLLSACNGNVEAGKAKLASLKSWAESKGLEWSLETAIKRFHSLNEEKKRNTQADEYREWYRKEYGVEPIN